MELFRSGVPNLGDASPWGDARGLKEMFTWVHLYQWGDAIDVKGDADTKRLGTPGLDASLIKTVDYSRLINGGAGEARY